MAEGQPDLLPGRRPRGPAPPAHPRDPAGPARPVRPGRAEEVHDRRRARRTGAELMSHKATSGSGAAPAALAYFQDHPLDSEGHPQDPRRESMQTAIAAVPPDRRPGPVTRAFAGPLLSSSFAGPDIRTAATAG